MGNQQIGRNVKSDPLEYLSRDLPNYIRKNSLGRGKFMKSYLCKVADGVPVVVKVFVRSEADNDKDIEIAKEGISTIQKKLNSLDHPNVLPYQRAIEGKALRGRPPSAGYVVRQHFYTSLYDRLSTRPFLSNVEERFICYQLFKAVEQAHSQGVCHGDIKSENVMVTSWTWCVLTDFASFKPTFLPDDDTTDFNHFFASTSSNSQHRCYLAPERFYSPSAESEIEGKFGDDSNSTPSSSSSSSSSTVSSGLAASDGSANTKSSGGGIGGSAGSRGRSGKNGPLTEPMDIFSLGCVVAEVFLGGAVLDLPSLLKYRAASSSFVSPERGVSLPGSIDGSPSTTLEGSSSASSTLNESAPSSVSSEVVAAAAEDHLGKIKKIESESVKKLVRIMLRRDPDSRGSVKENLNRWEAEGLFPPSFGKFLYRFMVVLQREVHAPDDRILFVCRHYARILASCVGVADREGTAFFAHFAPPELRETPGWDLGLNEADPYIQGLDAIIDSSSPREFSSRVSTTIVDTSPTRNTASRETVSSIGSDGSLGYSFDALSSGLMESKEDTIQSLSLETKALIAELKAESPLEERGSETNKGGDDEIGVALPPAQAKMKDPISPPPPTPSSHLEQEIEEKAEGNSRPMPLPEQENSLIIIAQLVCSCIRHVRHPQSKLLGLQLLLRFGRYLDDEARLQRLVPYVMTLLEQSDQIAAVRALAVRVLREILSLVTSFSPSDADIFPKYIFPALDRLPKDPEELVRIAFAESMTSIAESSRRFLDISQSEISRTSGVESDILQGPPILYRGTSTILSTSPDARFTKAATVVETSETFDEKLQHLRKFVLNWFQIFMSIDASLGMSNKDQGPNDSTYESSGSRRNMSRAVGGAGSGGRSNLVKRALLRDITRLCIFFGPQLTQVDVSGQVTLMAHDSDWELRYAYCAHLPALAAFQGPVFTESVIEAFFPANHHVSLLVDAEELVVSRSLRCLATLAELGLLKADTMLKRCEMTAPLLLHPGAWVRRGTILLMASVSKRLGFPDTQARLLPLIQRFLTYDLRDSLGHGLYLSKELLSASTNAPVSRRAFKMELLRLAEEDRKGFGNGRSREQSSQSSPLADKVYGGSFDPRTLDEAENAKLKLMEPYMKMMARNLNSKFDNILPSSVNNPAASRLMAGNTAAIKTNSHNSSTLLSGNVGNGMSTSNGTGCMSRLHGHSEKLNATPYSSLFVPKSGTAVAMYTLSSISGDERDRLLRRRRRFLADFLHRTHGNQQPITIWSLPWELRDVGRLQALYGITHNPRDAQRLAEGDLSLISDNEQLFRGTAGDIFTGLGIDSVSLPIELSQPSGLNQKQFSGTGAAVSSEESGTSDSKDTVAFPKPNGTEYDRALTLSTRSGPSTIGLQVRRTSMGVSIVDTRGVVGTLGEGTNGGSLGMDAAMLQRRILALGIPPLPPSFGVVSKPGSGGPLVPGGTNYENDARGSVGNAGKNMSSGLSTQQQQDAAARASKEWRPKVGGVVVQTLDEHVIRNYEETPYSFAEGMPPLLARGALDISHAGRGRGGGGAGLVANDNNAQLSPSTSSTGKSMNLFLAAHEHSGSVNRLAVSQDHSFFVSASSDGTSRVWATKDMDALVKPHSAASYVQQTNSRILDVCMVENSHSVCTASSAGDVHVWRVNQLSSSSSSVGNSLGSEYHSYSSQGNSGGFGGDAYDTNDDGQVDHAIARSRTESANTSRSHSTSLGTAEVRRVPATVEGPVVAVAHYNTDTASTLIFGTQKGFIHCWDLRAEEEPHAPLRVPPELGFLTTLAVGGGGGADRHWMCAGTSRGFILIWDLRFRLLIKLWRHSSRGAVHRLATCARLPEDGDSVAPQPLAFVSAGFHDAELAVWNLATGGICRRCFRAVKPVEGVDTRPLPTLDPVPLPAHPAMPINVQSQFQQDTAAGHSVRAIMGRISASGNSYVITGDTERHIRFWDFMTPTKCFTVSGLTPGQPRPAYDCVRSIDGDSLPENSLFVCYDAEVPNPENVVPSQLPIREQRGLVMPSNCHTDAVLDLKSIDFPSKMMLSCDRAGVVKLWK